MILDPADREAWPEPTEPVSRTDAPSPRRYKLTLAYDGTHFHGWQKQLPPGEAELRTVAGVVQATLISVLRQPIELVGASRTDSGVHAAGQVAHFDAACRIPVDRLPHAINRRLPGDVLVREADLVPDDFHAIRHAVDKQYRYRVHNLPVRPLWQRHFVSHCRHPLEVPKMQAAASRLVGEHDFAAFAAAGHGRVSTVRTVHRCDVEAQGPEVHVVISGNGFLYNMVRIVAGTLVEIGRGRLDPGAVERALTSGNRREAGPTMPPEGLCLEWIRYEPPGGSGRL